MKLKNLLEVIVEEMEQFKEIDLDLDSVQVSQPENEKSVRFNVGDLKYVCNFMRYVLKNKKSMVEMDFQLLNSPQNPKLSDFFNERQYLIALGKSRSSKSGTGNPLLVFKNVLAILRKYLKDDPADYITFVGDEDHKKIYQHADHYFKKYLGYTQIQKNPTNDLELSDGEFWFEKIT